MASIDKKQRAGPVGRPRLSHALMQRKGLMDPRLRRSANLLATERRTARGSGLLSLDYTGVPLVVEVQMRSMEAAHNDLVAKLQAAGLMHNTP